MEIGKVHDDEEASSLMRVYACQFQVQGLLWSESSYAVWLMNNWNGPNVEERRLAICVRTFSNSRAHRTRPREISSNLPELRDRSPRLTRSVSRSSRSCIAQYSTNHSTIAVSNSENSREMRRECDAGCSRQKQKKKKKRKKEKKKNTESLEFSTFSTNRSAVNPEILHYHLYWVAQYATISPIFHRMSADSNDST